MGIRTILFDLDGTLLDTNELIKASFKHTFDTFNFNFTDEEIKSFNGPPLMDTFTSINPDYAEEMLKTYREYNMKYHDDYVEPFPKVVETIKQLKEKQIQMAVVTNKNRQVTDMGLDLTILNKYFTPEKVITIDDLEHPKPHPEAIIKAMGKLNGEAETTLMVGDNYHDINAGHHAGVKTAGVSWSEKGREYLEQFNPTYMIDEMEDLLRLI